MVTNTFKLPPATSARLAAEAKARRVTKSQIIRELLDKHFKASGKSKPVSFYDMTHDLLGTVDGPSDLATNPKHMKNYGK
jgi:hypothetical protein